MTTKHTPGPWFAERLLPEPAEWGIWHEDGVACLAKVRADIVKSETGESNARLMAAAPAMLAVCEGLAAWWMKDGISGNSTLDELASQARTILRDLEGSKK